MISEGKTDTLSESQFFQDSGENKLNPNKIIFRIKVKNPKYIDTDLHNSKSGGRLDNSPPETVEGRNPDDFESKPTDVSLRTTSRRNVVDNPNKKTQKVKKVGISREDKAKMWDIFDSDSTTENSPGEMKCLYQNENESGICDYCNSVLVIMDDGFPTCTNMTCGVIYKNTLDYSPEWRFYGAEDKNKSDPTRCGNPINPLLVESSFGCKVICSNSSSYEMRKIRKWTEWQSMPHKEKSLYDEFQFITIMAQNAGIPKIFIDDAISIHKDISEQKMFRGMNRDGIKSASIYISCRLNGCPRTAHEIAEIFRLDKASATAGCSMAVKILHNIERNFEPSQQTELCSTRPSAFIERYCSKLNINGELIMLSKFIAKKVEENSIINNNTPHAIAAGIVFFISQNCNLNINKLDIKTICGVSEVTINKCYKKLEVIKENLIPLCILDKYT
jgi:transcription initiation factor TFIIB